MATVEMLISKREFRNQRMMSQQLHPTFMPFMQAAIQKQWQPTLSALVDQKQKHDAKSPEAHHYIRQSKNTVGFHTFA